MSKSRPTSVASEESIKPTQSLELQSNETAAKLESQAAASSSLSQISPDVDILDDDAAQAITSEVRGALTRTNSQDSFATPEQTIIIFDWDDTLFPTTWIRRDKGIHWRYPLENQNPTFTLQELLLCKKDLKSLQDKVEKVLTESMMLGHVVVVTLSEPPWVELSCDNFFPQIGRFLKKHDVKVVYARDVDGEANNDKRTFQSDNEALHYWTQRKQKAIMSEVRNFYAQSSSTWKNVVSLGDSNFERFATQAALKYYSTLDGAPTELEPQVGSNADKRAVLKPSISKGLPDSHAVSGWVGEHFRRLRCKTVKMFDVPGIADLTTEMSILHMWMPYLVERDAGFDVDLDDATHIYDAHFELTGENLADVES